MEKEILHEIDFNKSPKIKKFTQFKNMFNIKSIIEKRNNSFFKQANSFLTMNSLGNYYEMIYNGYIPSKSQEKISKKKMNMLISSLEDDFVTKIPELTNAIKFGFKFSEEQAVNMILHNGAYFNNKEIFEERERAVKEQGFSKALLKKLLKEKEISYKIINLAEVAPHILFNNLSYEQIVPLVLRSKTRVCADSYFKGLKNAVEKYYAPSMRNVMNDVKNFSMNKDIAQLTVETIQIQKYSTTELPPKALELIKNIENIYIKIKSENKEVNELDILFEKRVPDILKKYLTIDEDYRTILKNNNGLNAEELMLDSLQNMQSKFQERYEAINQQKVSELSASNKYTKSLKI